MEACDRAGLLPGRAACPVCSTPNDVWHDGGAGYQGGEGQRYRPGAVTSSAAGSPDPGAGLKPTAQLSNRDRAGRDSTAPAATHDENGGPITHDLAARGPCGGDRR